MKKTFLVLLICLILVLSACGDKNRYEETPTPNITRSPAVTPSPTPSSTSPVEPSPSSEISPTPEISDLLRPEKGTITVENNGAAETVDAELIYQQLNASNPFIAFSIYSDTDHYEYHSEESAYRFTLNDESSETTYLEISYIMGIDAESLKPSFADDYIKFTDISFSSFSNVGWDNMECTAITASNSQQYLEAYLINVEFGVAAVVLSSQSNSDIDANRLSAMLDTLIVHEA